MSQTEQLTIGPRVLANKLGSIDLKTKMARLMNDSTPISATSFSTRSPRVRTILAAMVLLLFFPFKSPAPIYGLFPGLSNLLEHADAVVVADIVEQSDKNYSDGGVFKIRVRKVLKGKAVEEQIYSAYLRDLGFSFLTQSDLLDALFSHKQTNSVERESRHTQTNSCPSLFPEGMKPGARGVFFLTKSNGAVPELDFLNENAEGDAFAVNPKADLKTLAGLKPREAIELLLRDSLAYHNERFPSYTAAVARMMGSP